jgi:hypothetical protein
MAQEDLILMDSAEEFAKAFTYGWIVDGRGGGLVLGRKHGEGHILMIQPTESFGVFQFVGYMEGGEYIMSRAATDAHFQRIEEINRDNDPCDTEITFGPNSRIIRTDAEPHDKLLVVDSQYIINARSTKRHFHELEEINSQYRHHEGQFFSDEITALIKPLP